MSEREKSPQSDPDTVQMPEQLQSAANDVYRDARMAYQLGMAKEREQYNPATNMFEVAYEVGDQFNVVLYKMPRKYQLVISKSGVNEDIAAVDLRAVWKDGEEARIFIHVAFGLDASRPVIVTREDEDDMLVPSQELKNDLDFVDRALDLALKTKRFRPTQP